MRRGFLVAGAVLLVIAVLIGIVPRSVEAHIAEEYTPTSTGTWIFSDILQLQGGISIEMSWQSTRSLTFGIGRSFDIANYEFGLTAEPELIASSSGTTGTLTVVLPQSGSYRFAMMWEEGSGPVQIVVDLYATQPNAYGLYSLLVGGIGLAILTCGFSPAPSVRRADPNSPGK